MPTADALWDVEGAVFSTDAQQDLEGALS